MYFLISVVLHAHMYIYIGSDLLDRDLRFLWKGLLKKPVFLSETQSVNLPSAPWANDFYTLHTYTAGKTVESLEADSHFRSSFFTKFFPSFSHSSSSIISFSSSCHLQPIFLHIMRRLILCLESYLDFDQTPLQLVSRIC